MRRAIAAIVSTVAALVLLLSFKTQSGTAVASRLAAVRSGTTTTGATGGTASTGGAAAASPTASSGTATSGTTTVTGDEVDTRYGAVQVQITVTDGKVTAAEAIEYPTRDGRDAQINSYAVPILNSEAVAAGSATIDMVSGATYTSQGYLQSLQSALDKA